MSFHLQCRKRKNQKLEYSDLILLFEQLFIYTSITNGKTEGILGADNGSAKFKANNGNPVISVKDTILVREISLGYYGRYKTPLLTMNILNNKSELQLEEKEIKEYYGEARYNEILNAFESFISSSNKRFEKFSAQKALYAAVFGKFRKMEFEFWIKRLYELDGEEKYLMKLCYENINKFESPQDFLHSSLPAERKEVSDILELEPFLRCVEEVFYAALSAKTVKDVRINNISEHIKRYNDFCLVSTFKKSISNTLFNSRMNFIKENCSPDRNDYVHNVIEYHKLVCRQKKSSNWIEIDSQGHLQAFVYFDNIEIDIDKWGRDYYLNSLKSIKNEMLEIKGLLK